MCHPKRTGSSFNSGGFRWCSWIWRTADNFRHCNWLTRWNRFVILIRIYRKFQKYLETTLRRIFEDRFDENQLTSYLFDCRRIVFVNRPIVIPHSSVGGFIRDWARDRSLLWSCPISWPIWFGDWIQVLLLVSSVGEPDAHHFRFQTERTGQRDDRLERRLGVLVKVFLQRILERSFDQRPLPGRLELTGLTAGETNVRRYSRILLLRRFDRIFHFRQLIVCLLTYWIGFCSCLSRCLIFYWNFC